MAVASPEVIAAIRARLAAYLAAEAAVLNNQSYKIENRELARAPLSVIRQGIADLKQELSDALGQPRGFARGRARRGVIR